MWHLVFRAPPFQDGDENTSHTLREEVGNTARGPRHGFYVNTDIGDMKHSQSVTVNGVVLFYGEAVAAHPGTGTRGAELQTGALSRK